MCDLLGARGVVAFRLRVGFFFVCAMSLEMFYFFSPTSKSNENRQVR